MVKILHIITTLEPEGAQTLLLNTVQHLNPEKYNISIVYLYKHGTALENFNTKDVRVIDFSNNGKFNPFVLFKLIRLIQKEKIEIIHTHLVHAGIVGKLAAKLTGVKHIITTRHYGYANKQDAFLYHLEEKLTASASVVIAISESVKGCLIDRNIVPEKKIAIIYNGVDLSIFNPEQIALTHRLNYNELIIGSVGRLHPSKGFHVLLRSFKEVIEQIPNAKLEIIGNGELREDLQKQTERLNIADQVKFIGSVSQLEVATRMKQWDVFVMASLWEGLSLAVIEAMAMKRAVVATKVGGNTEIVEDGKTGFLVQPNDPEALAFKVIELLKDKSKRIEMGKLGRERVVQRFSLEQTTKKLENIYDQLIRK